MSFTVFLLILLSLSSSGVIAQQTNNGGAATCPLDFSVLRQVSTGSIRRQSSNVSIRCHFLLQILRLVYSDHLLRTGSFLPPIESSESCWIAFQSQSKKFLPNFEIRSNCGFQTPWISRGCMNLTTKSQFEALIPKTTLTNVVSRCNQSLESNTPCARCTASMSAFQAYLTGPSAGNVSDCTAYPSIYAAAFSNQYGPTDKGIANCLFQLDSTSQDSNKSNTGIILGVVLVGVFLGLTPISGGFWFFRRKREVSRRRIRKRDQRDDAEMALRSGLESIGESTTLTKFSLEEIKKATNSFSRHNIIGRGGYGNVFKGVMSDGSELAFKRFKNCSANGDANFVHEVEVIASIRHVNLVALRGYCTATTPFEGHQRILVCDLVKNGSLDDHLFGDSDTPKLSWPIRQKIALGMARGLSYLHYGAQPAIIHRDIKASNILLDEDFEAKVADFGLAKFNPEGMTHMSTRVAGTMGYVAPEYALYGQLTERSDVYGFGVVLLELLSGKKALVMNKAGNQPFPITEWAWGLVREGRSLDVVEDNMPELGDPEVLEKYVLIAVLCSHPQLYARPTMDQVVKLLETGQGIPSIPDRPIALVAEIDEIERSASSSGSGKLSSPTGYQPFTFLGDHSSGPIEEQDQNKVSKEEHSQASLRAFK